MKAECPLCDATFNVTKRTAEETLKQHVNEEHRDEVEDHAEKVQQGRAKVIDLVRDQL